MARLIVWNDLKRVKSLLAKRLKAAKRARSDLVEQEWRAARTCVFGNEFTSYSLNETAQGADTEDFDITDRIDIQYAFRNLRLIHSQMSSNPPVATAKAQSTDIEDRKAAEAAEHAMQWFREQLDMQGVDDLANLDCLVCGTGVTRTTYNADGGDPIKYDEETEEMVMEGAIELDRVQIDYFWPDANAKSISTIHHTFEMRQFTAEQAQSRWPDAWPLIRRTCQHKQSTTPMQSTATLGTESVDVNPEAEPLYDLYWYYEPGMPENGFLGRYAIHAEDGTLIDGPDINPNLSYPPPPLLQRRQAAATGKTLKRRPPTAYLPYQIVTDIDVPDRLWGRSALYYAAPAQRLMSNIDSATLEMVRAHGVARLIMPPGAKMSKDAMSNTSLEYIQLEEEGSAPPQFVAPPGMPAGMTELRQSLKQGVDDMWGVNENMLGQSSREQSAVNMQYSVNQGMMVRRRLFNKSIKFVQDQYRALLSLAIQHWDVPRALAVLGQEEAYSVAEFVNMDLYCGYEIVVEYGTHLPLDPMARRDELLKMMPIYQQVGVSNRSIVAGLKMADLEYVESIGDLSRDRAQEIIDTIINKGIQVPLASQYQDHEGFLAYFLEYVNTASFDRLPADRRSLIDDQIKMRTQAAAQTRMAASGTGTPTGPAAGPPSGPGGAPGMPAPGAGGSLPATMPGGAPPAPGANGAPPTLSTPPAAATV